MPINYNDSNAKFRLIWLSGRLDIAGTAEIEGKFAAFAATERIRVIVDLTGVNFLSSIGIRAIISNAKAQQQRGGKMVLFVGENATVAKTLELTGIATLIPTFKDMSEAEQAATQ
ncbi:MAG: STAS domain-containing protein [Propionivibrio sp.]|uniref:Anti-sigma factor antagonist n=1 Tax=Candidatus Propionivibrio dominans TaxID=2954373 RepID=A0A9D7FHW7_9RHOO|nr:STAS domain-containing protein [Candidatus Propionivibrio dominans]MBL0165977.1 STAS domain-containing protein [Propionivibrio sp.]